MQTSFEYVYTTQLPLPPPKANETWDDVARRGMEVALELLHDPDIMIKHDKEHLTMRSITGDADEAVPIHDLAAKFKVPLSSKKAHDSGLDSNSTDQVSTEDWNHFEVTELIPILFGMSTRIKFHSALRFNDNGMEALANPGSSVTLHGKWTVEKTEGNHDCLTLREVTITDCNVMLGWYIKATMSKAHANTHAYLKERFGERMGAKMK